MINISSNQEKNKNIKFIPRFNKFMQNSKIVKFDMYRDFNFKSIVNITTMKFVTLAKGLLKFLAKTKNTTIKVKADKNSNLSLKQTLKIYNILKLKNIIVAKIKLDAKLLYNKFSVISDANSKVSLKLLSFLKSNKINIKTLSNDSFILTSKSYLALIINVIVKGVSKLFLHVSENNKLDIKSKAGTGLNLWFKSKNDNKLQLKNTSNLLANFYLRLYTSSLHIKSTATAVVYKPRKLSEIYSDKIENWYDKSLDEIFYGETIE